MGLFSQFLEARETARVRAAFAVHGATEALLRVDRSVGPVTYSLVLLRSNDPDHAATLLEQTVRALHAAGGSADSLLGGLFLVVWDLPSVDPEVPGKLRKFLEGLSKLEGRSSIGSISRRAELLVGSVGDEQRRFVTAMGPALEKDVSLLLSRGPGCTLVGRGIFDEWRPSESAPLGLEVVD